MDNKFYVSLEAARLLKKKGYNEECDYCFYYDDYNDKWDFDYPHNLFDDEPMHYNNETIDDEMYSMPTKAEAIDWLDSKEVIIEVLQDYRGIWFYVIKISETESYVSESYDNYFSTRLEAEEAAIIKALELL
jgi:hypothetical protein